MKKAASVGSVLNGPNVEATAAAFGAGVDAEEAEGAVEIVEVAEVFVVAVLAGMIAVVTAGAEDVPINPLGTVRNTVHAVPKASTLKRLEIWTGKRAQGARLLEKAESEAAKKSEATASEF
jgi:hypothetical protein